MKQIVVIGLLCLLLTGCTEENSLAPLVGRDVYVIYRRDALGYSTEKDQGIPADTVESGSSGQLSTFGTLKKADQHWVLLESPEGIQGIPTGSILAVREVVQNSKQAP